MLEEFIDVIGTIAMSFTRFLAGAFVLMLAVKICWMFVKDSDLVKEIRKSMRAGDTSQSDRKTSGGRMPMGMDQNGHAHIQSTELPKNKKLEQLENLLDAGLLSDEEYKERLAKIQKQRK